MITFIRSDDRLIHGQCQTKIIPMNKINRVICVDDPTANNPMLKRICEMAAPNGVRCTCHTLQDALTPIRKCCVNDKRTLIIARRPSTLLQIFKEVPELPKLINVANIPFEGSGVLVRRDCYVDDVQKAALNELDDLGIDIFMNQFPNDGAADFYWKDVRDKY